MGVSQTKNNLRWSVFVFAFLLLSCSALYVVADEASTTEAIVFDDGDGDGLSNDEEKIYGTDPDVADTDNDSYSDGVEIKGGFDPLKPAPGDRVVPEEVKTEDVTTETGSEKNLTEIAAEEFNNLIDKKTESGETAEITSSDLDTAIAEVMSKGQSEVVLPDVETGDIKVKLVAEKLPEDEKKEQSRQDAIEYLTLVSYILISNSPVQIRDTSSLQSFLVDSGNKAIVGMMSGNFSFLDTIEEKGRKSVEEINKLEVPESMLGTHVKALQMMTFAANLKQIMKATVNPNDPLGQMYSFSKLQGFMLSLDTFISETQSNLAALGVESIPLDI
ncbi:MAG: hypothetical protein ACEQSB_03580 [Undibacterium sp.]